MRPIDIRIGHDNDLVIAQFVRIEGGPFSISSPDSAPTAGSWCGFRCFEAPVQPGFFHIDELSTDRKNGLHLRSRPCLAEPPAGVTLHNALGVFGIAVEQSANFPGRPSGHAAFADRFPGFFRCFPSTSCHEGLLDDRPLLVMAGLPSK